jgi:Fe2+ or Zn2+ uptake regulation protein
MFCNNNVMVEAKDSIDGIRAELSAEGFRWTGPREEVLSVLARHSEPLSARRVREEVGGRVNLASVYRTLELFLRQGVVVEVDGLPEGRRYELSDRFRAHHHHVVCRSCGDVRDVEGCLLDQALRQLGEKLNFLILSHEVRVVGLCGRCRG